MGLKAVEAISQFYLGQSLYPSKKGKINPIEDPLLALCGSVFRIINTPMLLFSAIIPFSTTLQSFGYRPLSAWQGRIIYLSPLVLKGGELVLPEDHKGKINAASQYYHSVVQAALALAILRISQKEGYHHALGAVSGVSRQEGPRCGGHTADDQDERAGEDRSGAAGLRLRQGFAGATLA